MALMVALQKFTPSERAAFLLHDVFEYTFDAVATVLDKQPATCRQLASRARKAIREERTRFDFDPAARISAQLGIQSIIPPPANLKRRLPTDPAKKPHSPPP